MHPCLVSEPPVEDVLLPHRDLPLEEAHLAALALLQNVELVTDLVDEVGGRLTGVDTNDVDKSFGIVKPLPPPMSTLSVLFVHNIPPSVRTSSTV